jgi:hypothetical protein
MNLLSLKTIIPLSTAQAAPLVINARLHGKYLLGIQVYTDKTGDVSLRLMDGQDRVIPDPGGGFRDVTGLLPFDGWYYPANADLVPLRETILYTPPELRIELSNVNAANAVLVLNLFAAAAPPDETTLLLLRDIQAGMTRFLGDWTRQTDALITKLNVQEPSS